MNITDGTRKIRGGTVRFCCYPTKVEAWHGVALEFRIQTLTGRDTVTANIAIYRKSVGRCFAAAASHVVLSRVLSPSDWKWLARELGVKR